MACGKQVSISHPMMGLVVSCLLGCCIGLAQEQHSTTTSGPVTAPEPLLEADGGVHLPPITVPFSSFASKEAKTGFIENHKYLAKYASVTSADIAERRQNFIKDVQPALNKTRALYPTLSTPSTIAGVYVDVITPADGIAAKNQHRVLINLHGGAFVMGARIQGALESIPAASMGKIKVVTVDYREAPEYKFPAASEDVVAVYRDLLKSYQPQNIGIYGCSAGGLLTAEVMAWIEKEHLPRPGAIGIFCASTSGWAGGDSAYLSLPLIGIATPADAFAPPHPEVSNAPYFSNADFADPLVAPIRSSSVLAKFPPTLILTATRDSALSSAVYTHTQLVKLGVTAELHVWEGLGHGFFTSVPDAPESKDAWDVVTKFFNKYLGSN